MNDITSEYVFGQAFEMLKFFFVLLLLEFPKPLDELPHSRRSFERTQ